MADSDVLKEFIVALGFRVDEEKHKVFQRALKMSTEEVNKLGLAITSVSVALAAGFQRITDQFASLYYTSQLTGQTIQSLKDLQYAAGQVGLSAGDMNSALRTAALLLQQPGGEALIRQYTGFKGHIKDAHQALSLLGHTWQKMFSSGQGFMARAEIGNLGLNVPAMELYAKNIDRAEAAAKDYDDRLHAIHLNTAKLAEQSVIFKNELAKLWSEFALIGETAVADFIGPVNAGLKDITDDVVAAGTAFGNLSEDTRRVVELFAIPIATIEGWKLLSGAVGGTARALGLVAPAALAAKGSLTGLLAGAATITAMITGIEYLDQRFAPHGAANREKFYKEHGGPRVLDPLDMLGKLFGLFHGDQTGRTIPLPQSYTPGPGGNAGMYHQMAYRYGMDAGGSGNQLLDWLRGTGGFTPPVRIVGFSRFDENGTSPTGVIPASYEPGGSGGGSRAPLGPGGTPGKLSAGGAAMASKLYRHARAPVSEGGLGMDRAHALAMIGAGAFAESYLNPAAVGDNGTSFGMFQEHGARGTAMLGQLGPNWRNDPLGQLDFAFKEQQQRDPGWFQRGGSAGDLGNDWERSFERPKFPTDRSAFVEGISRALGSIGNTRLGTGDVHHHHGDRTVNVHAPQNVTINGQADASAVGAMHTAHERKLATAVRNIAPVFG